MNMVMEGGGAFCYLKNAFAGIEGAKRVTSSFVNPTRISGRQK